ncbi:MAG TPA: S4 domain-containing protein, partial [Longimicrobium sp.]
KNEIPDDIPEHEIAADDAELGAMDGELSLPRLLVRIGLAVSNSDAQRQLQQGAVQVDGEKVVARDARIAAAGEHVIRKGKRHFARVRFV